MSTTKRSCLSCGRITRSGSRCLPCTLPRTHSPSGRAAGRLLLKRHRMMWGNRCPGWDVPSHFSDSLVIDHPISLARGGPDIPSNMQVLCPGCNNVKGDAIGYSTLRQPRTEEEKATDDDQ